MKLKKTKKMRKMRGTRLHGYAAKKHKGKGNIGGKGMSGTGKRGDQKKSLVIKKYEKYFGKQGITSKKTQRKKTYSINLRDIELKLRTYLKNGRAKKEGEQIIINLEEYKILGSGELKTKAVINAREITPTAMAKIEKSGGKAIKTGA